MSEQLLQINQIHADIEEKEILHGVSLNINPGETHVLMGPNGAGKSTLGHVLMGNPKYHISSGNIIFKGNDITGESTDKRARDGIFLSFQPRKRAVPGSVSFVPPAAGMMLAGCVIRSLAGIDDNL